MTPAHRVPNDHTHEGLVVNDSVAFVGSVNARLLAGPVYESRAETFDQHEARLGPLGVDRSSPHRLRSLIGSARLVGRGGGEFPLSTKLDAATNAGATPLVVVNASEGEPASKKDATLLQLRPHLVLDGAEVVAMSVGSSDVTIYVHGGRPELSRCIGQAIRERSVSGDGAVTFRIVEGPGRYVSGEASAVVSLLERGVALPRRKSVPLAVAGIAGQPTIVSNTETYAHAALIVRFGSKWFREAGSVDTPGSTLLTIVGSVPTPGVVIEILHPVTLGSILARVGEVSRRPRAVLLGGYAGVWIDGATALMALIDRHWLRQVGAPLGCGVVGVLGDGLCGLAETARILDWMAGESSGQCGPCVTGLPAMAEIMFELADGRASARDVVTLQRLAVDVRGRGACGHPTGAANLLESTLDVFSSEIREHLRGRSCEALGIGLPLPHEPIDVSQ